jgi:hypothetical protein
MNYSSSLPTRTYPTTIGDFTVSDLCSYFKVDDTIFVKTKVEVDKSQTLVEASNNIYDTANYMWLFLFANKKINPFDLLKQNKTNELNNQEVLTGVGGLIENTASDAIFLSGSIVVPSIGNTGATWSFSATGGFSLTGGFALVDSFNPFSKRFILKELQGGMTLSAIQGSTFTGAIKDPVNGYTSYGVTKVAYVYELNDKLDLAGEILYQNLENIDFIKVNSEYPFNAKGSSPAYKPLPSDGITQSDRELILNTDLNISVYTPSSIRFDRFTKVVQNYSINS